MSDGIGLFEAAVASVDESERQRRIASDKLAAATYDVKDRFGEFLFAARDVNDFNDRVALCRDDMVKVVEPHLFPRTGTMRRICKALERELKAKLAAEAKELKPKGDFKGYLDSVDDNARSKVDVNFTGEADEHTGDPAKTLFAKCHNGGAEVIQRFASWCKTSNVRPTLDTLDRYAARGLSDEAYLLIAAALQRKADGGVSLDFDAIPGGVGNSAHADTPVGGGDVSGGWGGKTSVRRTAAPDYLQKADESLTNLLNQRAEEFQQAIAPLQQALQVVQQAEAEQQAANPFNVMPGGSINPMPGAQGGAPAGPPPGGDPATGGDPSMGGGMPPGMDPSMMGGDPSMGGMPPGGDPTGGGMPPQDPQQQMMARRRQGGGSPKAEARKGRPARTAGGVEQEFQDWVTKRPGLPTGTEADIEQFAKEKPIGQRALKKLKTKTIGVPAVARGASRKEALDYQAADAITTTGSNHRVAGWEWDDHLSAHVASAPRDFSCTCGQKIAAPSGFKTCKCGKQWNSYVIGTGGDRHEASADKYLVREIPVRDNVIVAATKDACGDAIDEDNLSDEVKERRTDDGKKESSRDFAQFVADAYAARESSIVKLTEPGEITEGEDPGTATMKQQPADWARRDGQGKWNMGPRKNLGDRQ